MAAPSATSAEGSTRTATSLPSRREHASHLAAPTLLSWLGYRASRAPRPRAPSNRRLRRDPPAHDAALHPCLRRRSRRSGRQRGERLTPAAGRPRPSHGRRDGLPGEEDRHLAGPHRLRRRHPRPVRLGEAAGGSHRRCTGHPAGAAVAAARRPPTDASPAREPAAAPGEAAERQAPEGGEEGRREASRLGPRGLLPVVGRPTRLPHDLRLGAGAAPARHHPLPRPAHAPGGLRGRRPDPEADGSAVRGRLRLARELRGHPRGEHQPAPLPRPPAAHGARPGPQDGGHAHCLGGHRHRPRRPAAAAPPPRRGAQRPGRRRPARGRAPLAA